MARRLRRLTKSSAVKKLTIIWAMVACSPISSAGISVQGTSTGGNRRISTYIMTAAIAPVTTNVATVMPMILPARLRLSMLATALEMEANTIGTTTQNIMLMNTVPMGLRTVAPVPEMTLPLMSTLAGHSQPTRHPSTMADSITPRNR